MVIRIYADLQNCDQRGRVRLNAIGTIEDLARQGVKLEEGLAVVVHDTEDEVSGVVQFDAEGHVWVVVAGA